MVYLFRNVFENITKTVIFCCCMALFLIRNSFSFFVLFELYEACHDDSEKMETWDHVPELLAVILNM